MDDNLRRNEFNELLRASISDPHQLFDIARVESTLPDGTRSGTPYEGRTVYTLAPAYTTDGGHLSPEGRRRVAEYFLAFLALGAAGES